MIGSKYKSNLPTVTGLCTYNRKQGNDVSSYAPKPLSIGITPKARNAVNKLVRDFSSQLDRSLRQSEAILIAAYMVEHAVDVPTAARALKLIEEVTT